MRQRIIDIRKNAGPGIQRCHNVKRTSYSDDNENRVTMISIIVFMVMVSIWCRSGSSSYHNSATYDDDDVTLTMPYNYNNIRMTMNQMIEVTLWILSSSYMMRLCGGGCYNGAGTATTTATGFYLVSAFAPVPVVVSSKKSTSTTTTSSNSDTNINIGSNIPFVPNHRSRMRMFDRQTKNMKDVKKSFLSLSSSSSAETEDDTILSERLYEPKTKAAFDTYLHNYRRSIDDRTYETYWSEKAYEYLDWDTKFHSVLHGTLSAGDVTWFAGGKLNLCYNAIDRHVYHHPTNGNKVAMLWEGDEPTQQRSITYNQLLHKVSQIANALLSQGVQKGDVVTIYMPMIPELPMTMLACARIGAIHSVVFAGFSSEALSQRIIASSSKFLITSDIGKRGGKTIPIYDIVQQARQLHNTESILQKVMIWQHNLYGKSELASTSTTIAITSSKDIVMDDLVYRQRPYCQPVSMDAEDNLFILYTSGSTGQPKGVVHTTGGYGLWAAFTTRQTFDLQSDDDIFACVADCGWITGHTYVVYGPLLNGGTTFLFESTPLYPTPGRYWDMIERHGITQFYTAPTAIRSLMRYGNDIPKQYNLSSLKILGSVGEPINPEAWRWYYECIGKEQCTIVDTYWQTETGGHIITNLPGITPMKPGSCTLPMYGIDPVLVDPVTGKVLEQTFNEETGEYNEMKGVRERRKSGCF
jgi:acyl-coenzyme A synthetase/AMP-(fatty) acid ligase